LLALASSGPLICLLLALDRNNMHDDPADCFDGDGCCRNSCHFIWCSLAPHVVCPICAAAQERRQQYLHDTTIYRRRGVAGELTHADVHPATYERRWCEGMSGPELLVILLCMTLVVGYWAASLHIAFLPYSQQVECTMLPVTVLNNTHYVFDNNVITATATTANMALPIVMYSDVYVVDDDDGGGDDDPIISPAYLSFNRWMVSVSRAANTTIPTAASNNNNNTIVTKRSYTHMHGASDYVATAAACKLCEVIFTAVGAGVLAIAWKVSDGKSLNDISKSENVEMCLYFTWGLAPFMLLVSLVANIAGWAKGVDILDNCNDDDELFIASGDITSLFNLFNSWCLVLNIVPIVFFCSTCWYSIIDDYYC
jgi:hypothetical protein